MMDDTTNYDADVKGNRPPPHVMAILTTPEALRARAAVRLDIARQDDANGDGHASWRNRLVAQDMLRRADEATRGHG